ncbi:RAB GDP/GTP exchange factor, putative [Entamoeba invadens IP1]|uniref:RAB GDP/GTP exchange factor, putative n=1 Tax=Entamoeba invadens IP1 TaxID=370355 RepID=UPI0002C3DE71|nr:RAB GDP/GTP exchange factor, putative [Entamoeba invadens IP1]ELP93060.1 RAB GDP/GTP exchange factor, putative [Entamoeba invadens IP1]|eukprot:XP_004259831.1 RAB GDP/GTP exchange factor, putative [Entamoeba invadens IP1]
MKSVIDANGNQRWKDINEKEDTEKIRVYFPNIISEFCRSHGFNYTSPSKITPVPQVSNNPFFRQILGSPLGIQALLYCIKYGLTLVVPLNPPELSIEFLSTHMIVRKQGGKDFVSLNGIYGTIESEGLSPYTEQLIPFPTVIHPEILSDRESFNLLRKSSKNFRSDGGSSFIEGSIFEIPFGNIPILFISQTLRFEGCMWGFINENVQNEWKVKTYCPLCIPEIDVNVSNEETIQRVTRTYSRNSVKIPKDLTSRKKAEEREKERLKKIFQTENLVWIYSNVEEEQGELESSVSQAMSDPVMVQYISATKSQFPELVKGKSCEERAKLLKRVVNQMVNKLPQSFKDKNYDNLAVRKVVENITTSLLFEFIWPPAYGDRIDTKELVDDNKLSNTIEDHQFIRAVHLDVGFLDEEIGRVGSRQVIGILRKMNNFKTPSQKLVQLGNAFKALQALTFSLLPPGDSVTADVLLPSFIYIVIRANLPHLSSTYSYLSAFSDRCDPNGEYSYYLTNLFGAISFLLQVTGKQLTIDEKIYEDAIQKIKVEKKEVGNLFDQKREDGYAKFERMKDIETLNELDKVELLREYKELVRKNEELRKELNIK